MNDFHAVDGYFYFSAAKKEEKKEESESDEDMGFGKLFISQRLFRNIKPKHI